MAALGQKPGTSLPASHEELITGHFTEVLPFSRNPGRAEPQSVRQTGGMTTLIAAAAQRAGYSFWGVAVSAVAHERKERFRHDAAGRRHNL
jgi:hypothetical protein